MTSPQETVLQKLYACWSAKEHTSVLNSCAEKVKFEIPGKSKLAGKYTRENFAQWMSGIDELSGNTFKSEVHDIFANERHGMVLVTNTVTRNGKTSSYRATHVWRFEGNKPVAFYLYPRDLYEYDAIWG